MERTGCTTRHHELEQILTAYYGRARRIIDLCGHTSSYASSHALEELDVVLDDGARLRLVCKDVSRAGMLADARRAKPAFLDHPRREIEMYRTVLGACEDAVPNFFGAIVDQHASRDWLILERVIGLELRRVGEFDIWETAMNTLGMLHTRAADSVSGLRPEDRPPLLCYDRAFYQQWPVRAAAIAARLPGQRSAGSQSAIERLAARYDPIAAYLAALPPSVIHGDCFPSNVLVEPGPDGIRTCFVDWEMAALGPALIDVAALTAGAWTDLERERLVRAYHAALDAAGRRPPSLDELLHRLAYCRLHLAMQLLGWSSSWLPPSEQEQDWLGEALMLAETLV